MLCYKNGALAREQVRNKYASADWQTYNQLVQSTPIANNGTLGFYFPLPEIIPPNVQGNFFFNINSPSGVQVIPEEEVNPEAHPRAILESQFLSIRSRINAILPPQSPPLQRLVVCGGGSNNAVILQLAADVFGMKVFISGPQGAAEGGAQLARYAWWREQNGGRGTFEELRANDGEDGERFKLVAEPKGDNFEAYAGLIGKYRECEDEVVKLCANLV